MPLIRHDESPAGLETGPAPAPLNRGRALDRGNFKRWALLVQRPWSLTTQSWCGKRTNDGATGKKQHAVD
jgi:hypothetical protein